MPVSKKAWTVALIGAAAVFNFAHSQSFPSAPTIGSISSPSMPTITAPAIGDGYYIPGNTQDRAGKASSQKNSKSDEEKELASNEDVNSKNDKSIPDLSAKDLMSLFGQNAFSNLGGLGGLSGLGGGTSFDNIIYADRLTVNGPDVTEDNLKNILKSLGEIKSKQDELQKQMEEKGQVAIEPSPRELKKIERQISLNPKKILRFSVNGYDLLRTCRTIYISDMARDGSFLVTGDRNYLSDGKSRSETFHILFQPSVTPELNSNYVAAAAVTQDYLNKYSFIYQLSQREHLTAQRTGNFITMRTSDDDWKLEFLLDLGKGENN